MFTKFARRIGNLPPEWSFVDVFGFDDEALRSIPRPVAAVILLFPCTDAIYAARADQKRGLVRALASRDGLSPAAKRALHVEQVSSFGNACGSIAAVHALANADLSLSGPLAQFKEATSNVSTARERGNVLVASAIHGLSDECAADVISAQTECPANGDTYLGHHYCCFVSINGHIVELDGTKAAPVDHGISCDLDLLKDAARVVREVFMSVEPDRIDFSLMALAKTE